MAADRLTEQRTADDILNEINSVKLYSQYAEDAEKNLYELRLQHEKAIEAAKQKAIDQETKRIEKKLRKDKKYQAADEQTKKKILEDQIAKEEDLIKKKQKAAEKQVELDKERALVEEKGAAISTSNAKDFLSGLRTSFGDNGFVKTLSKLTSSLDAQIEAIAKYQSVVDTRLQGSNKTAFNGNYWNKINRNLNVLSTKAIGLIQTEDLANNTRSMIQSGISFNVEQRAFLNTIKDKIADTFDATNGTLLKLVRIQQQDSTAARLGLESSITAFLNEMYDNTEYLGNVMNSIKDSLAEAESLMSTTGAVEFEYQVQKWMGSLYSVGFTNTTGIAQAINQLASGDISGLTGSGIGNLMITAANRSGLSLASILKNGLDADTTNELMTAMVSYLQQIAGDTKDSKLMQQQYANVYGLTASDLKAAANLSQSMKAINGTNQNYSSLNSRLTEMLGSAYLRTSAGELASNTFSNLMYSMSSGIASNAVLYGTYKIANLLEAVADGMDFSLPMVMGNGTAQTFNIAQLMKAGALGGGILSNLGNLIGIGTDYGITNGWSSILGLNNISTVQRGNGQQGIRLTSGFDTSSSTYVGNSDGSAVTNKTMTDTQDEEAQKLSVASGNTTEKTTTDIYGQVDAILEILKAVTGGTSSLSVSVENLDNFGSIVNNALLGGM